METGGEEINPGGQEISPGTSESCHWVVAEAKREGRFWKVKELESLELNAALVMEKVFHLGGS